MLAQGSLPHFYLGVLCPLPILPKCLKKLSYICKLFSYRVVYILSNISHTTISIPFLVFVAPLWMDVF